jgi:transcriptional regulator with XRE-family HTH domain
MVRWSDSCHIARSIVNLTAKVPTPFKVGLYRSRSFKGWRVMRERELNPGESPAAHFGSEVREARNYAKMSQPELGLALGYDGSYVSKVEHAVIIPDEKFVAGLDPVFPHMNGWFMRFWRDSPRWRDHYREWFKQWVDAEKIALSIRTWQPLLIPGLLQTEAYARAVFEAWQAVDGTENTEADIEARLARQAIFERPMPPSYGAVVDESVLYRGVGGPKAMHEQLLHVAEMSERPRISVQVLQVGVGAHVGLLGGFDMAGFGDASPGIVYLESPGEGETTKHPATVARIGITYDALRDHALGVTASRDLLRKVAEERWTP